MKLAFLIERINYYKSFGPIIDEALRKNFEVICLHDLNPENHSEQKQYLFPSIEKVPRFLYGEPIIMPYVHEEDIISIIKNNGVDVLIIIVYEEKHFNLCKKLKRYGVKITSLQHSLDTMQKSQYLDHLDRCYLFSERWLEFSYNYLIHNNIIQNKNYLKFRAGLNNKVRFIGFPEMDQCRNINPESVRKEWALSDKPVALLLPFPFDSEENDFWNKYIYGMNNPLYQLGRICLAGKFNYYKNIRNGWNDYNVVKSIRKFCDANNMQLIIKSRMKDRIRKYVSDNAVKTLYDEEYYPATILKCLSIADICVYNYTSTILESAYMGVPSIGILPEMIEHLDTTSKDTTIPVKYAFKEISDYPGINYLMSIPDCIKKLPTQRYSDYICDINQQRKFVETYLGYFDGKSSERMLNDLELLIE